MSASLASRRKRAAAYIQKMGPAIQGQHGDDHTYKVAAVLMVDFALPFDVALEIFRKWNATCQPPWREREIIAKLHGAVKYGKHQLGGKIDEEHAAAGHVRECGRGARCSPLRAGGTRAPRCRRLVAA